MKIPDFDLKPNEFDRLQEELKELEEKNLSLYNVIMDLKEYVYNTYSKTVMITMIYRTDAEQDDIYKNNERYKKKKFKSPHQFLHAVDFRNRGFTGAELEDIVMYLNSKYDESNYYDFTALSHDVGRGDHLHIQFWPKI